MTHIKSMSVTRSSDIINMKVYNLDGENIGKISELAVDMFDGRIAYAVLQFGGIMGVGDKLFAIPWDALHIDEGDDKFILNISKDVLQKAGGFDEQSWPDFSDRIWGRGIYD